ncbi:hypothetical protein DENSPDRAFT_59584 [Dentipellis sp. KUC8613]|nr:hypothetical protein DENSPDRAFT_59584 [Dentipellis sp. KUC8613]
MSPACRRPWRPSNALLTYTMIMNAARPARHSFLFLPAYPPATHPATHLHIAPRRLMKRHRSSNCRRAFYSGANVAGQDGVRRTEAKAEGTRRRRIREDAFVRLVAGVVLVVGFIKLDADDGALRTDPAGASEPDSAGSSVSASSDTDESNTERWVPTPLRMPRIDEWC